MQSFTAPNIQLYVTSSTTGRSPQSTQHFQYPYIFQKNEKKNTYTYECYILSSVRALQLQRTTLSLPSPLTHCIQIDRSIQITLISMLNIYETQ